MKLILTILFFTSIVFGVFGQCDHTIQLYDTYSDGWNGGTITISVGATPLYTDYELPNIAATDDLETLTFSATTGEFITITRPNEGSFPEEMGVRIIDGTGTVILEEDNITTGGVFTFSVSADCGPPQVYTSNSLTTTQTNTTDVQTCFTNQEIIGVQLEISGNDFPLDFESITIQTNGSTNALSDIANINLFYTGNSATFSSSELIWSGAPLAPGNDIVLTGAAKSLQNGTNYFWIAYDIDPNATIGNSIDATCTAVIIEGNTYNPTVTNPGAGRTLTECTAALGVSGDMQIWLKANDGASNSAGTLTGWTNQGSAGAITINGTSSYEANGYNFNPKTHFNGNGNFLSYTGGNFGAMFAVVQLDDLTRVQTHLSSYQGISGEKHVNENWHGGQVGSVASYATVGYSTKVDNASFRTNGTNTAINTTFSGNHEIIDVNMVVGETIFGEQLLGGQYSYYTSGSSVPERDWLGDVSEMILFDADLTLIETIKIESYLAIKYGLTLGTNGTSIDYLSANGTVVWDQSQDANYNWDIIGVAREDNGAFDQRKSHTEMFTGATRNDILTVAYGLDFANPSILPTDRSYYVAGHDGGNLMNTGAMVNYTTDNSEIIETIFDRQWLSQETGTAEHVTLEFDLSAVPGVGAVLGANDLDNLRLLIDEDGDFSTGASSISPTWYDNTTNIAYFKHDFVTGSGLGKGFYFTLGSVLATATPLPVELSQFLISSTNDCEVDLFWETASELNNDYFTIERSMDANSWETIITMQGAGTTDQISNYAFTDRSIEVNGVYYYRLKQVDFNGTVTYSAILTKYVHCLNLIEPHIYPNPNTGAFKIAVNYNAAYSISAANGKIVTTGTLSEGINDLNNLNLSSGLYTIRIESANKIFVNKLIVQ